MVDFFQIFVASQDTEIMTDTNFWLEMPEILKGQHQCKYFRKSVFFV